MADEFAETDRYFVVPGVGKVAKGALSPERQATIRSQYGGATPPAPTLAPVFTREDVADLQSNLKQTSDGYMDSLPMPGVRMLRDAGRSVGEALVGEGPGALGTAARTVGHFLSPGLVDAPKPKEEPPAVAASAPSLRPEDFVGGPSGAPLALGPSGGPAGMALQASMGASAPGVRSFQPRGVGTGGVDRAFAQQQKATEASAAVAAQQAAADAARQDVEIQAAEKRAAQAQERQAQRDAFMQQREKDVEGFMREATKDVGEVDPGRWFASRDTGQKVLAGVSSFLSGFGGGGPGYVQRTIEQDIAAQRDNIALRQKNRQQAVGNSLTLLETTRQRFGDEIAAERAAEAAALGIAQQRAQLLATRAAGEGAKAKGAEMVAALEVAKQEKLAELRARNLQLAMQAEQNAFERTATVAKLQQDGAKASQPNGELTVPGYGQALDKDAAKKGRELVAKNLTAMQLTDKLIVWRKEHGAEKLDRDALAAARTTATQLQLALKNSEELGTLDKGSQEVLDTLVSGDPGEVGQVLPRLQALRENMAERFATSLYAQTGIRVGAQSFQAKGAK